MTTGLPGVLTARVLHVSTILDAHPASSNVEARLNARVVLLDDPVANDAY